MNCQAFVRQPCSTAVWTYASNRPKLAPSGQPRIICCTNVAETSLTVPGIRVVVDSGEAMVSRFDPEAGIDRLLPEKISQFSATQRSGRANREGPGWAYRLWSAADNDRRSHD